MNIFQKLFCRAYQFVFRLAMPILPYRDPKLCSSVEEVPQLLKRLKKDRVLLVTDSFLRSSGITASLEKALESSGIFCCVYDATRPNPTTENVEQARSLYLDNDCQALIAFGGGSSMDCAKAVGARISYPRRSLGQLQGLLKVLRRLPTLIAIPTTAGTGSEVTVTAVITDPEKKHKYTMNNFTFIPSYAVLDPSVTVTLPPHLTATTGMDALTHAVEAYIGRSTTAQTRKLSLEAVSLIFSSLERAYHNGTDIQARKDMLHAAHKAGIAFSKSYVGYIHAIAHSLGGQYNIPHGLANSVLMPIVLESYGACVHQKLHALGVAAGVAAETDDHREGAEKFISAIREKNKAMGIPEALDGICGEDIPHMAKYAHKEANPLYPVPVLMSAKELEIFYFKVRTERQNEHS